MESPNKFSVAKYLLVSLSEAESLLFAVTDEAAIAEIVKCLMQLDEVTANLSQERNTSDYALTRVDVLEWEPGLKTAGMEAQIKELKDYLAILLNFNPSREVERSLSGSLEFNPI